MRSLLDLAKKQCFLPWIARKATPVVVERQKQRRAVLRARLGKDTSFCGLRERCKNETRKNDFMTEKEVKGVKGGI